MNGTRARRVAAVERYIHELAIALADVPADEREEVIAGVRDHIEDALVDVPDPEENDVQHVLTSLGDPAEIAADARGRSNASVRQPKPLVASTTVTTYRTTPMLARDWVPVATMAMFVGAVLVGLTEHILFSSAVSLLWLGGLVLLIASPLWSSLEKVVGAIWFGVLPVLGVYGEAVASGSPMRFSIDGGRLRDLVYRSYDVFGGEVVYMSAVLVGMIGTVVIMAWLISAGSKRARRIEVFSAR